jgi:hypothetical protein
MEIFMEARRQAVPTVRDSITPETCPTCLLNPEISAP